MLNLPPDIVNQISANLKRPEGTVQMVGEIEGLFDPSIPGGVIFEIPAGSHVFRLERDSMMQFHFYHAYPGKGTRVATINLTTVTKSKKMFWGFTWSPDEIQLFIGPNIPDGKLTFAKGVQSTKQFRTTPAGVFQIGDSNTAIMGTRMFVGGTPVLQPTAKDAWVETIKAIDFLHSGKSDVGYIYEVVISNLTISTLVTGFETYCKTRFIELESEGITPNSTDLSNCFFASWERADDVPTKFAANAAAEGKTYLEKLALSRINFQNYDDCKRAYNLAYGVKFGELGVQAESLALLKRLIRYRHRIIHVSPLIGMLNQPDVPPEEPVMSTMKLAQQALQCFDTFIQRLHQATLGLRRID